MYQLLVIEITQKHQSKISNIKAHWNPTKHAWLEWKQKLKLMNVIPIHPRRPNLSINLAEKIYSQ